MKTNLKQRSYSLLLIRSILLSTILIFGCANDSFAQLQFLLNSSNNYMAVNSYMGKTSSDAYVLKFTYSGNNLNLPKWKISARVIAPIVSSDGLSIFPADKISLIPIATSGSSPSGALPSFAEIGTPASIALEQNNEVFLVPESNAPLYNVTQWNSYYVLSLNYSMQIAAGVYLRDLQGDNTQKKYTLQVEFTAYGTNNEILGKVQTSYNIEVFRLTDSYIPEKRCSIQVSGDMQNTTIEFMTKDDYASGKSITYDNGIVVSSTSDYQMTVRSTYPTLSSIEGYTLPLDIVKIHPYLVSTNTTAETHMVTLSGNEQIIVNGTSTNTSDAKFNLTYSVVADQDLIQARPSSYSTIIIYEVTPK